METTAEITSKGGLRLQTEVRKTARRLEVAFRMEGRESCVLHWGLARGKQAAWHLPPRGSWPQDSRAVGEALQTPFRLLNGEARVHISLEGPLRYSAIVFALYFPEKDRWDNNDGRNFFISLPAGESLSPVAALREWTGQEEVASYALNDEGLLALSLSEKDGSCRISMVTDLPGPLMLHWGAAEGSARKWRVPPKSILPQGTTTLEKAAETPFTPYKGLQRLSLEFREKDAPAAIPFVLRQTETGLWYRDGDRDFLVSIKRPPEAEAAFLPPRLMQVADDIIRAERERGSWTLMHRFNLCHDLLDRVDADPGGLALLFVWLRFSAIRQLDWQRNYNTKPKELSLSQDRLTIKLADIYVKAPGARELVRLMTASLGRGGEGQRIRDEILNIMHRHHIKEVSGHFMEEWHQKLHNNTTPDDIVICEAYIKFLEGGGVLDVYYETLEKGGVNRERLESFERPILTPPDFVPHLKDALIHDFYEFLRLLRSIHSGTDLESALNASRHFLGGELADTIDGVWRRKDDPGVPATELARDTARARGMLKPLLEGEADPARARDMLYLDLALEEFFRVVVEKNIHAERETEELVRLTAAALRNQRLTCDDEEFSACSRWWDRLTAAPPSTRDFALHAKAVTERLGRALGSYIDRYYGLFQPKAEFLGKAFRAEAWTVKLFTEELVRGRPAFTFSQVLRHLDPVLRREAELGSWQVISPGRATGRVEAVKDLGSVQNRTFREATVILAEKVKGDEEPPEGVAAVITPDSTDIVSHVAVRARNVNLLFATCYDAACFEDLKEQAGRVLTLSVNPSGDVIYEEAGEEPFKARVRAAFSHTALPLPEFRAYAVSHKDFEREIVGGKSINIKRLMDWKDRFPEDVRFPRSAAVPFGVFERVFEADINREMAGRCRTLMGRMEESPEERLGELRATLLELEAPGELMSSLKRAMEDAGLSWPGESEGVWDSIKRVWASKWNHRAYLSRKALGIPHEDIYMAVLVQEVVDPQYAFVAHTANPFTGKKDELYAELAPGLGETLVGNYPGRAMGFVSGKAGQGIRLTAYPSKSTALRGGGLIFRSDSNGEDLAGYAGAGLYESVMLESPARAAIDYAEEPVMWDKDFRDRILGRIAETCVIVEGLFGVPQDIEGAYAGGAYYIVQSRPQVGALDG